MAVKTTYTCDLCGHTQNDLKQMWWVSLCIDSEKRSFPSHRTPKIAQLWCRPCAVSRHLLPFTTAEKKAETPPEPTLEDLVREIVREEMDDA